MMGLFGHQATPIPFAIGHERIDSIAKTIVQHFAFPA
jgi:hypothetical protein